jgi:hypothetical protein
MLIDECSYAVSDILPPEITKNISQDQLNELIKKKCAIIGWHYQDRIGTDGIIYTAFAPTITGKNYIILLLQHIRNFFTL